MSALLVFGALIPLAVSIGFLMGVAWCRRSRCRRDGDPGAGPRALEAQLREERQRQTDRG